MYILDSKINKSLFKIRDSLLSEFTCYLSRSFNKITKNKIELSTKVISCFLLNSHSSYKVGKVNVGLTLDKTSFKQPLIVNGKNTKRKISYRYTRSFLDFLVSKGYIEIIIGGNKHYEFINGKWVFIDRDCSYAILKFKMLELFGTVEDFKQEKLINVLKLRNKDKREIPFKMDTIKRETKRGLDDYNEFSLKYVVTCFNRVYDVQMYKVYNENFHSGGRSFMRNSVQGLSGEDRKSIEIDGESVCIYDYKGFEPSLAYTMSQEVFEGEDYYKLEGLEGYDPTVLRQIVKHCMLIMFNVNSRENAVQAINDLLAQEYNVPKLYQEGLIPYKVISVRVILENIEVKHHLISHNFYKGFGVQLQNAGSYIADYITDYMMQTHNALTISVFDEFIAKISLRSELYKTMQDAYTHVLGFNDNCKITEVC